MRKERFFWLIICWSTILLSTIACRNTSRSENERNEPHVSAPKARVLNVQAFHAVGNGKADDTKAIQTTINAAQNGDTILIPPGIYRVKTLVLKSAIHIRGVGLLRQSLAQDTQRYTRVIQNSSTPLFFGRNIEQVSLSFFAETRNEALYISNSKHIKINFTKIQGDRKKLYSFPGMLFYACDSIQISHSSISNYGAPRQSASSYQAGTGIRFLSCQQIQINDNEIIHNGENGIFMHGSGRATIHHNRISDNGMSAIQIGFGKTKREQHFIISNNFLARNAADAIDINNRITPTPFPIYCTIRHNNSLENGFVQGQSTVDGSGLATLVNVSEVRLFKNQSRKSNRPALYLEKCGKILAEKNVSDNKVEIVHSFDTILLQQNKFDALTLLAHTQGKRLQLTDNTCRTLLFPNGVAIDSLLLISNTLENASLNINMQGSLTLYKNTIHSEAPNGALLLTNIQGAQIKENSIKSTAGYAVTVNRSAQGIILEDNEIQSVEACVFDGGSENLTLLNNELRSLAGGRLQRTFISQHPNSLRLKGNTHRGGSSDNSIRLEGTGTAFISDETIKSGYPDYGKVTVKEF
ncbi:hypothetical protein GCM10023231_03650 [Olivibacter ginsenosidimutans]|uniref:Rhamnogalacturonase A/B/Epimerase-like pectate lyase domain-containing protein n=1 Tax=Olivibacter ginsenosidimutans TaxID=1176537 RepID=A0ABP9AF32_9SPHI